MKAVIIQIFKRFGQCEAINDVPAPAPNRTAVALLASTSWSLFDAQPEVVFDLRFSTVFGLCFSVW